MLGVFGANQSCNQEAPVAALRDYTNGLISDPIVAKAIFFPLLNQIN